MYMYMYMYMYIFPLLRAFPQASAPCTQRLIIFVFLGDCGHGLYGGGGFGLDLGSRDHGLRVCVSGGGGHLGLYAYWALGCRLPLVSDSMRLGGPP